MNQRFSLAILRLPVVRLVVLLFLGFPLRATSVPQASGIPEVIAIRNMATPLKSNLRVLSLAFEPGEEDLASLAYWKFARQAKIMSAYVTNGESGVSNLGDEYPLQLAATLREEASQALSILQGDVYFLNLPDFGGAGDSRQVRDFWGEDSLQSRLAALLTSFKPDIVILCADEREQALKTGARQRVLEDDLVTVLESLKRGGKKTQRPWLVPYPTWNVQRVFEERGEAGGFAFAGSPRGSRGYSEHAAMAEAAMLRYRTEGRKQQPIGQRERRYDILYPKKSGTVKQFDDGLSTLVSARLKNVQREVSQLSAEIDRTVGDNRITLQERTALQKKVMKATDSIDVYLPNYYALEPMEQRSLVQWKDEINDVKNALLGVRVSYVWGDSILVPSQLTTLKFNSVTSRATGGETSIYVPGIDEGWFVNEDRKKSIPMDLREPFRILSPAHLDYNLPSGTNGLRTTSIGYPFIFFVIHKDPSREKSWILRITQRLFFAPRFTTEMVTPIVRAQTGEKLIVRLTNHSRDGVRDSLSVRDSLVTSNALPFRLNIKDGSQVDTLVLRWRPGTPEGTHFVPVNVGGIFATNAGARKFDVMVDSAQRVGVLTPFRAGALCQTLSRLGITPTVVTDDPQELTSSLSSLRAIILDQRITSLLPLGNGLSGSLEAFAQGGGNIIVLAQDADTWNEHKLFRGISLKFTGSSNAEDSLIVDSASAFFSRPNALSKEAWDNWIFFRTRTFLTIDPSDVVDVPLKVANDGNPLIISKRIGKGRMTYMNLDLHHQWINILPSTFRLLANLLSS